MDAALDKLQVKQAKDKEEILATSDALAMIAARMLQVSTGRVPNRAVKLGANYSIKRGVPVVRLSKRPDCASSRLGSAMPQKCSTGRIVP